MPAKSRSKSSKKRRAPSRPPRFPIAYVKYHDHCWLDAKDLKRIRNSKPYVVEETGFLLHETPQHITLARERGTDGEKGRTSYDAVTIIMRSDILDLQVFEMQSARRRKKAST